MKLKILAIFVAISMIIIVGTAIADRGGNGNGGPNPRPVIYVTGQGLYYDSIVTADPLPWNEHNANTFQLLNPDHTTAYGPGDTEYKGGRWWMDTNPNGYQDEYDHYFSCPLLGPGYEME